jgi:TatD DNase family protein
MFIDSHAHIDDPKFNNELHEILKNAREAGIGKIITIAASRENCGSAVATARGNKGVFCAVGVIPHDSKNWDSTAADEIRAFAADPANKVVAVGEIGLDFYYDFAPDDVQWTAFKAQMDLARELNLPVVIHNREAQEEMLHYLAEAGQAPYKGVMHCYAGNHEQALRYMELGFHLSFAGNVTFKKAVELQQALERDLLPRLLIETDCPYLAPVPKRGKRNEPAFVAHTAAFIAGKLSMPVEEIAGITSENAEKLFGLPVDETL